MIFRSGLVFLALAGSLPAQNVHLVDDSGGADFTTVHEAVAAAASGDIVIVKTGVYSGDVTIDAKSLVVAADTGAAVDYSGRFLIQNLGADQSVLWSDFDVTPPSGGTFGALDVLSNAGPVWIDGVTFDAFIGHIIPHMIQVNASGPVVFLDCSTFGGTFPGGASSPGLRSTSSDVYLHDSNITGGNGYGGLGGPFPGGTGVLLSDGRLFSMGSVIQGGQGTGVGSPFGCTGVSGAGGTGLLLTGSNPVADLYDTDLLGGLAGALSGTGTCTEGPAGSPLATEAGTVTQLDVAAKNFTIVSPVREFEPVSVTISGDPGDLVWVAFSTSPTLQPFPGIIGPLFVGSPLIFSVGALGITGELAFAGPAFVPPGAEGQMYYAQALFVDTLGQAILSEPAPIVELKASL